MDGLNELTSGIEATNETLARFIREQKETVSSLQTQMLEIAQSKTSYPVFHTNKSSLSSAIEVALSASDGLKRMKIGEAKELRFNIPADSLNLKAAILGPVSDGASALQDPDRAQEIVAPAMQRQTVLALIPSLPTTAGATQYTQQLSFTSGAAIQGGDSSPLEKEGAIKGEAGFSFSLVTSPIQTIACWVPASEQVLSDMTALTRHIDTWLRYDLAIKAEDEILNGT